MQRLVPSDSVFGVVSVNPGDQSEEAAIATRQSIGDQIASKSLGQLPAPPFISSPIEGMPGRFSKIWEMWFTRVWQNRLGGAIAESPEDEAIRHAFHDVTRPHEALIQDIVCSAMACLPQSNSQEALIHGIVEGAFSVLPQPQPQHVEEKTEEYFLLNQSKPIPKHNTLSGRSDSDAHPASSITFTPYLGIAAIAVQDAIQEVYDESERSGAVAVHAAVQSGVHGLAITAGKTLTATQSITLTGTDTRVYTFPTTNATIARTDAGQTFTGQQTISHTSAGQLLLQGYANSVASALNGELLLGSTEAYRCRIGMDAATGNTTLYIDSTYNSASALIKLRTRTAGTPIDCLTLSGSLATFGIPVKAAYQSSDGTAGLTATRTFYAASSSGGAVNVLNTVTIKDGIITSWTQA